MACAAHRHQRQIRIRSLPAADEDNQPPQPDRQAPGCAGHYTQLEHNQRDCEDIEARPRGYGIVSITEAVMAEGAACLVDAVLKLIGDRWTLCLIHELSKGPQRTLELHSAFGGLSTKTLSDRLKNLRKNGLVSRMSYPESPPRVEYSLTEKGSELLPLFHAIARTGIRWGIEWKKNGAQPRC